MKKLLLPVCGLLLIGSLFLPRAQTEQPDALGEFMRAKLEHSQKILEGLTTENYDMIAKNSQELSLLSLAASWQVLQTPEYNQQSLEFRRLADQISKAAEDKNLDGAALAYVGMTMKCVECHKYVRGAKTAQLDFEGPTVVQLK